MEQVSIKNKLLSGIIWNAIEKVLVKGTAFAIGIVLARLLSPSDLGRRYSQQHSGHGYQVAGRPQHHHLVHHPGRDLAGTGLRYRNVQGSLCQYQRLFVRGSGIGRRQRLAEVQDRDIARHCAHHLLPAAGRRGGRLADL